MLTTQRRDPNAVRSTVGGRPIVASGQAERLSAVLAWTAMLAVVWLLVLSGAIRGGTIYVDSRLGNDRYQGRTPKPTGFVDGPVQTLSAALHLVNAGDVIELANNGVPYYGSATLYGARHSGVLSRPFEIRGNGATLTGAKPIARGCWRQTAPNVWRVTPFRKAHYQLVLNGAAARETACERTSTMLPEMPTDHWCAWRGAVYYHAPAGVIPETQRLALADEEVGFTLIDVENVVIRDLTLQHFRLDGVNAHDRCREIELVNVTLQENGRAGLAVGGTSQVVIRESRIQSNREASVLVTELGEARLDASETDVAPTVVE